MSKRMTRIYLVMFLAGPRTTHTSTHESARSRPPTCLMSRVRHTRARRGAGSGLSPLTSHSQNSNRTEKFAVIFRSEMPNT